MSTVRPAPPTPGRQRAMQLQRTKDTAPEVALRRALHVRGLRFRLHQRLLPDLRRSADIVFGPARVVVDVRGCWWHGCEQHSRRGTRNAAWWDAKLRTNVDRDAETLSWLTAAGWLVLVIWEHHDPEAAADRIAEVVRARRQT